MGLDLDGSVDGGRFGTFVSSATVQIWQRGIMTSDVIVRCFVFFVFF